MKPYSSMIHCSQYVNLLSITCEFRKLIVGQDPFGLINVPQVKLKACHIII